MTVRDLTIRFTGVTLAGDVRPVRADQRPAARGLQRAPVVRRCAVPAPRTGATLQVRCGDGPVLDVAGAAGADRWAGVLRRRPERPPGRAPVVRRAAEWSPLGGGTTRIQARHSAWWDVASFSLAPLLQAASRPARLSRRCGSRPPRDGNAQRVRVPARAEPSVLWLRQSHNSGWVASVHGEPLRPLTLDGWQQGFLPPGRAGGHGGRPVRPGPVYRWGLLPGRWRRWCCWWAPACDRSRAARSAADREGGLASVAWVLMLVLLVVASGRGPWCSASEPRAAPAGWRRDGRVCRSSARLVGLAAAGLRAQWPRAGARPVAGQGYAAGSGWSQALCLSAWSPSGCRWPPVRTQGPGTGAA